MELSRSGSRRWAAALALASLAIPSAGFAPRRRASSFAAALHEAAAVEGEEEEAWVGRAATAHHRDRAPSRRQMRDRHGDVDADGSAGRGIASRSRRRDVLSSLLRDSLLLSASFGTTTAARADDGSSASSSPAEEPRECRGGKVVPETAVPGAYSQTCMSLDERTFTLRSSGDAITVLQGTNAAGGMAGRTGVAVWNSGILLTRLLDKLCETNASIFRDKSVLELGCGTGLASIAVAKLGASSVVATDSNPEVLDLAKRNIERNNVSTVAETAMLQWGLIDATEYENAADVIIGSDLTYNSGSWLALAETMATVLRPGGIVIYLTLGHSGFNVGGELGGFLSIAENTGLKLVTEDSEVWKETIGGRFAVDVLLANAISSEERAAIDANGGVRVAILGKKQYSKKW